MIYKFFFIFISFFTVFFVEGQFLQSGSDKFSKSSVLSDGSSLWYKIAIVQDGFHKITYNDLISYGIDKSLINSNSIHIYGNASGKLSESNNQFIVDDLIKNPVKYVGLEDGVFDQDDYIVFYAYGPNGWKLENGFFQRELNIYSNYSYYFIRVSMNDKRLNVSEYNCFKTSNTESNTYDYYDVHELEDTSIVSGGQRWYGEIFDNKLVYNIGFTTPTPPTSSLNFSYSFAANASSVGSFIQVNDKNNVVSKTYLSTVSSDYVRQTNNFLINSDNNSINLIFELSRNNPSVKSFLDKVELNTRCSNIFNGLQYRFRDRKVISNNGVTQFNVNSIDSIFIWDVTNKTNSVSIPLRKTNAGFYFIAETDSLREFAVSSVKSLFSPLFISKVENQNIHGLDYADLLIVTPNEFHVPAERLANIHRSLGDKVHVLTLAQIYNEFSSGSVDPTAIKLCAKMFYERFKHDSIKSLKNILLFGDGTFDPKNRVANNNYWVPTYQFLNSEDHLNAMVSDDYFGILSDNGSIYSKDSMEIGVGRLLISSLSIADEQIAKIEQYLKHGIVSDSILCCGSNTLNSSFGDWRTKYVQIADDEESGTFVHNDAEPQWKYTEMNHPEYNSTKIYLDAYKQVTMGGGERYPDVNKSINNAINEGALIVNYIGHGGEVGAAEERVITVPQINLWNNYSKLCLFVSSTCEFTKYDDPSRLSAGEWVSLNPKGGAIALMTTTRPVFFSVNTVTGKSFYKTVFERDSKNRPLTFGEILRRTKNMVSSDVNKHSFTLIGDPALRIALPFYKIVLDSVNGKPINKNIDTIKALSKTSLSAHIENKYGVLIPFNGEVNVRVFDKFKQLQTLGQDVNSPVIHFENRENVLFKGRAIVNKGRLKVKFITPKDIDYSFGNGKISFYANDSVSDAIGYDDRVVIGGISNGQMNDTIGPKINMYLNDKNFVSSGLTNDSPKLIIHLEDESGVNTIGNGIGHDALAILDNDVANPILLNNYYVSDLNSYQKGRIVFDFKALSEGKHLLKVKVWDVYNNPAESSLEFVVQKNNNFQLLHVLNYPNPFTSNTQFYFEHNQICNQLQAQIQIFTVSGILVKTIQETINTTSFRSSGINWDGRDDFGEKLAKGVYVYQITVKNMIGEISKKIEKLVIL